MQYACPIWRSAAPSHVRYCKSYNPSVFALRLTYLRTLVTGKFTRVWNYYLFYLNIYLFYFIYLFIFAEHRFLYKCVHSKLADAGNHTFRHLGRHLCRPRAKWISPRVTEVKRRRAGQPRLSLRKSHDWHNEHSLSTRLSSLRLFVLFLGCKENPEIWFKRVMAHFPQSWRTSAKVTPSPQVSQATS
jgi:hypothetical protein